MMLSSEDRKSFNSSLEPLHLNWFSARFLIFQLIHIGLLERVLVLRFNEFAVNME